jgi:hypothetical protein
VREERSGNERKGKEREDILIVRMKLTERKR